MDSNPASHGVGHPYAATVVDGRRLAPPPNRLASGCAAAPLLLLALLVACVPATNAPPTGAPKVINKTTQTAAPADAPAAQPRQAAEQPAAPAARAQQQATPHALDPGQRIIVADTLWDLVKQAEIGEAEQAASLLLPAISGFIEQGEWATAQTLVDRLQAKPMTGFQRHSLQIHRAQLAQALGRHARAIEWLRQLERSPDLSAQTQAKRLRLLADSQQALNRSTEALATLLRRDALPQLPDRAVNQQRILALIDSLDPLSQLLLRENPPDESVAGWVALNQVLRFEMPAHRAAGIRQWRDLYPGHPAQQLLSDQRLPAEQTHPYKHIAILLQLTSSFGKAVQAFHDGFMASHRADRSPERPTVSVYDIGADPSLISLYYRAAINDGADFIVGPLGRQAVSGLLAATPTELPVLMVGNIPEGKTAPNLYGISLSPEQEARQVAERAFFDGHRQAGILSSQSQWGGRVAAAFARHWEFLGGTVVENKPFPRDVSDYSGTVQKLLGLDRSIARERILTLQTGVNLQFTPRRRDDIDFLFLAANAGEARLLVPHLRFFQAHDLALYATARVYSGKPDPATDADLDGIVFGDMAWVLDSASLPVPAPVPPLEVEPGTAAEHRQAAAPAARAAHRGRESRPYYHTDLDRLYALGLESYRLIPELEALRSNQRLRHYGRAVDLSVEADGNILRHLTWARFDRGLPVPLPGTTVGIARPGAVQ